MFRKFIDESEIEEWFEEKKAKLSKALYDKSYARTEVDAAKKKYDSSLKKLIVRYNKEHADLVQRIAKRKKRQQPLKDVKNWWRNFLESSQKSRSEKKEAHKKEKFEKEYEKLMK